MLTLIYSTIRWAGLLSTAFLACRFGRRRAVDADDIAASDTVTRKLMRVGAYGGAFVRPIRKPDDNRTMTTVSALANGFAELGVPM